VVAVAELAPAPGTGHAGALATMLRAAPDLVARGVGYRVGLRRRGIPLLHGHCLTGIEASGTALRARVSRWDGERLGDARLLEVDVVAMGYGFLPADDVFRALGAAQEFDVRHRLRRTLRDADGRTSVPGLFGVGDCCGLGGAQAAQAEGVIAGLAVAATLGRTPPRALAAEGLRARAVLRRHRRFQDGLWRLFAAADLSASVATGDTVICRCEDVTRDRLDAVMDDGAIAIGAVKRVTRAGMGACQGRYCSPHLAAMIAARGGAPVDAAAFFAPRPPFKPVRIADLIGTAEAP